jgi:hypothetical protein
MMKKASEILSGFLDNAQLEKANHYNSFFRSWRTIVGLDIASHTRVHEIEGWKLIIEADHPGWAQKIEWKKRAILREIQKRYPELGITDIRVWIVNKLSDPVQMAESEEPSALEDGFEPKEFRAAVPNSPSSMVSVPPPNEDMADQGMGEKRSGNDEQKEVLHNHLKELGKLIREADKKRRH